MQDLVPELSGFVPRPSASSSSSSFALDPALAGPGPSSQAARAHRIADNAYWDDEDGELEYGAYDDPSEDETDAEDEYAAATQGSDAARRGRKSAAGGLLGEGRTGAATGDKGKGKADDQDLFALDDDDDGDEDLGCALPLSGSCVVLHHMH